MLTNFSITLPQRGNQHTIAAALFGAILLGWLSVEDSTVIAVSILGTGLSCLLVILAVLRWWGGRKITLQQWLPGMILMGGLVGFGAVWCTMSLMIFKNAWHSHAYPDFSSTLIVGISQRLIPWTIAGSLWGGATALFKFSLHTD